jgi:tRNA-Thr(GGU) m(6)t(6)A37 methyltransferase TsaA
MQISLAPIGTVHSPFDRPEGIPIQAAFSEVVGTLEIYPEYVDGLRDIEGFDYLILLYRFHLATKEPLRVTPFLDDEPRGVFATRAPTRPNRIGLSVVRLLKVSGNVLEIGNVDIVSGTPVIDIKPFVPDFDCRTGGRIGWLSGSVNRATGARADGRMR